MKKIYFAPETNIVKIGLQQMIAASEEVEVNNTGDALTEETSVASHRNSIWDDEE